MQRPPASDSRCAEVLEREPLFRAMFDNAPLPQAVATAEGIVLRINPAFTALLGYAPQDICGKPIHGITHPDDMQKSWWSNRRLAASSLPRLTYQKRYVHKNGSAVAALVTLSALELGDCRAVLGQIVDLTPLNDAQKAVQEAHERLRTALTGADAGTWEIDVETGHLEWDDALRSKFGLAEHEATPSIERWLDHVHANDRPSVLAAVRHATMSTHGRFDHEFRIRCPDGAERWYRCVGRVRRDEAGRPPRAVGIAIDSTRTKQPQLDRQRMEAAVHRAERRLAAIVTNSRDAIISASQDLRVTTWNASAEAMFGYTQDEAIGIPVLRLLAPERHDRIDERLRQLNAGETVPPTESVCLRKDGTRLEVEITLSPVPGDDGAPAWFCAIVRDITQRKATERQLRESQQRLEEIARNVDQVFWTSDPRIQRILYISPGYERIWGRSCESLYADPGSWIAAIHPDDQPAVRAALGALSNGTDFTSDYRVVRPDGSIRRVWDRGYAKRDAAGEVTHYVGVVVDITDRQEQPNAPPAR
jgi:PAS domain S-box-containing protein